jgi:hypothetical protein
VGAIHALANGEQRSSVLEKLRHVTSELARQEPPRHHRATRRTTAQDGGDS